MSTRRCWRSLCLTSKSIASTSLSEGSLAVTPNNYDYWQHGCSSKRPKKSSWNRRPNIGGQCGKRWKAICEKRAGASRKSGTLHLAQALSNRGRRGRKRDFPDAERLVKRLVAQELTLSFVPDAEQRLWRTVTRKKYQITRSRVQLHNRLESLLEEAHIKVSSVVSDLLGTSARRMLQALADGERDPTALASLADRRLRATLPQLRDRK